MILRKVLKFYFQTGDLSEGNFSEKLTDSGFEERTFSMTCSRMIFSLNFWAAQERNLFFELD